MRRAVIECSQDWFESIKKKVKKGKLYYYDNNVPQKKPIMFKI